MPRSESGRRKPTSVPDVAGAKVPWLPVSLLVRDRFDNAAKISEVLFEVDKTTGLAVACAIAMSYSLMAGFWGVVVTDMLQFGFAMFGAIGLAWLSWNAVGGSEGLAAAVSSGQVDPRRLDLIPGGLEELHRQLELDPRVSAQPIEQPA